MLKCWLQQLLSLVFIPHANLDCIVELLDHMTGETVDNSGDLFFYRKLLEMCEY